MIFNSNQVFLHWVGHLTLKSLDNSLLSAKASSTRCSKAAPQHYGSSTILNCWKGVLLLVDVIVPSVNKLLVCIAKSSIFILLSTEHFPRRIVVCPGTLWQRLVVYFFVFSLAMASSLVFAYDALFGLVCGVWYLLKP